MINNNTQLNNKIFGNAFDNISVKDFFYLDNNPENIDDEVMIRVKGGLEEYLDLDNDMPNNISVSAALLFLEISNNIDQYPEIKEYFEKSGARTKNINDMTTKQLFNYMKDNNIIPQDSVLEERPLLPIKDDFSKEELDELLKEADEIFQ